MKLNQSIKLLFFAITIACSNSVLAQTSGLVVGSGYSPPVPIFIAPGAITTIYVQNIGAQLSTTLVASTVPLPTKLGGISVALKQTDSPQGPIPVPILAVFPVNACRPPFELCGRITGINLQVPFELVPNPSNGPGAPMSTNFAQLVVSEEGGGQATVEAVPVSDRIHILRVGDTLTSPGKANIDDRRRFVFDPLVTHADGKLVSSSNPAQAGETLVLYAVGLGRVRPAAKSGEITPMSAPISTVVIGFAFNFRGEVSPQMPPFTDSNLKAAVFAGLSPGSVGLYQVNFVVPDLPLLYGVGCNTELGATNLTVSIGGLLSFDGVGICVRTPQAQP